MSGLSLLQKSTARMRYMCGPLTTWIYPLFSLSGIMCAACISLINWSKIYPFPDRPEIHNFMSRFSFFIIFISIKNVIILETAYAVYGPETAATATDFPQVVRVFFFFVICIWLKTISLFTKFILRRIL